MEKAHKGILFIAAGLVGAFLLVTQVKTFMGVRYFGSLLSGTVVTDAQYLFYWLCVLGMIGGGLYFALSDRPVPGMSVFQLQERTKKACPHCAEMIQAEAKICRFCQREVPAPALMQVPGDSPDTGSQAGTQSPHATANLPRAEPRGIGCRVCPNRFDTRAAAIEHVKAAHRVPSFAADSVISED